MHIPGLRVRPGFRNRRTASSAVTDRRLWPCEGIGLCRLPRNLRTAGAATALTGFDWRTSVQEQAADSSRGSTWYFRGGGTEDVGSKLVKLGRSPNSVGAACEIAMLTQGSGDYRSSIQMTASSYTSRQ